METRKELIAQLENAGVSFNKKATVAQLADLVASVNAEANKRKRTARKWGLLGSSKEEIRRLFLENGRVTAKDVQNIIDALKVKESAVMTALSDIKNPKYSNGVVIQHVKLGRGDSAVWEVVPKRALSVTLNK